MTAILAANPLSPDVIGYTVSVVVFIIFFTLAARLVWPKIIGGLDERYAKIRHEIDAAEKARYEAESAQKKFEEKLRQALILSRGSFMTFIERPVSATLLAVAAIMLIIALLPSMSKKREQAFQE